MAVYIGGGFVYWFISIIKILLTADGIHSITVKNRRVDGYGINTIPIDIAHDDYRCVLSISELSGVRGSFANHKILTSLLPISILILVSIVIKWHLLIDDNSNPDINSHSNIKSDDIMILLFLF